MVSLDLNGAWRMRDAAGQQWLQASVPGSVYNDLLAAGQVPDPFWRDNEDKILGYFESDYVYEHDFSVDDALLAEDKVLLHFDGLDTICDVELNGVAVGSTANMHRVYEWDVKGLLRAGQNTLRVRLNSSLRYLRENPSQVPSLLGSFGVNVIRKAQCAYGWDWGMTLPDAGIWRAVSLQGYSTARLTAVQALQHHGDGTVELELSAEVEQWGKGELAVDFLVTTPDGTALLAQAKVRQGKAAVQSPIPTRSFGGPTATVPSRCIRCRRYCALATARCRSMCSTSVCAPSACGGSPMPLAAATSSSSTARRCT